jgi:hypothetical protein
MPNHDNFIPHARLAAHGKKTRAAPKKARRK